METTRQSMTYGELPTREAFNAAFEAECPNGYRITLGRSDSDACEGFKLGDGKWSADELWSAIGEIVAAKGDPITVADDEEWENVFQVFYPGTDRPHVEIGPDEASLIEWANRFSTDEITSEHRAIECLNFASAYNSVGTDYTRQDARMDLVSSILGTLGFEWV